MLGYPASQPSSRSGSIYRLEGKQLRQLWDGDIARLKPRDETFGLGSPYYGGGNWFVFGVEGDIIYLYDDYSVVGVDQRTGEVTGAWETPVPSGAQFNAARAVIRAIHYENGFVTLVAVRFGSSGNTDVSDVFTARFGVR